MTNDFIISVESQSKRQIVFYVKAFEKGVCLLYIWLSSLGIF